jgi:hypothetical protein
VAVPDAASWREALKYGPLQELHTIGHGADGKHSDLGQLRAFMAAHGEDERFAALFPVAAHTPTSAQASE